MKKNFVGKENKGKKDNKTEKMQSDWKQIKEAIDQAVLEGKQGTKKEILQRLITDISEGNFEYKFTSKEKKFILKKLNGTLDEINKQEEETKRREAKIRNAEKAMLQIEEIVDREYKAGNIKNKASYLTIIRDSITGENTDIDLNIKIGKEAQEHLLGMIDDRIKDELYFEQVKNFTKGFQFLKEYPEIVRARHGASKMDKFTDSESYSRFSSLRELLQKEYNFEIVSAGSIMREMASSKGLSILDFQKGLGDSLADNYIDQAIIAKNNSIKDTTNVIFDSRLAWHFLPETFKIFIVVSPHEAALRTYLTRVNDDEKYANLQDTIDGLVERRVLENKRYKKIYGINCEDLNNYDLVIDTSYISALEATDIIMECYKKSYIQ